MGKAGDLIESQSSLLALTFILTPMCANIPDTLFQCIHIVLMNCKQIDFLGKFNKARMASGAGNHFQVYIIQHGISIGHKIVVPSTSTRVNGR